MSLPSVTLALLGLGGVSCLPQPTPHPEMRSTWPDDIFPGEECLPYDGSKVPDCRDFVDPVTKQPYYHEHSSNCSRFWECGPTYETCLFECAACCRCADNLSTCAEQGWTSCSNQCVGDVGMQWALTFDEKFHFFPEGPVCVWPVDYTGNCTNTPAECECLDWQTCINDVCSPQCLEDSQCPAGFICDNCGWCVEDVGCNNDNTLCDGHDALCNIPSHDNCFWCNGDSCAIGCAGDPNCPETHPICGHGGGEHLCGCTADEDCTIENFICDTGDLDGDGDSKECIEDGCYENNDRCDGHDAVCNIPDHENCFYCDGMDCKPGCIENENCPESRPLCGANGDHRCGCNVDADCPSSLPLCQDGGDGKECVAGCLDDLGCGCDASVMCDMPDHADCNYCDMDVKQCANGCCSDDNCPDTHPVCGYEGGEHLCGCDEDVQCLEGFICDGNMCVAGCRADDACGCDASVTCDIPNHEDCTYCDFAELQCKNGCCIDENCPDTHPVCGYEGGEHLCGCDKDVQCLDGFICDGNMCVAGCRADEACGCDASVTCDIPNHEDCTYCDVAELQCKNGCCIDENCPDTHPVCGYEGAEHLCGCDKDEQCLEGFICEGHACIEDLGCNSNDGNCVGFNETCTNPPPHNNDICFWCNGKDCELGCATTDNCPENYPICGHGGGEHMCGCDSDDDCRKGYECNIDEHKCQGIPGRILIDSISIYTDSCNGCSASDEGVKVTLLGKKDGNYPLGLPCHSNTLDHSDTTDFESGEAMFNGRKNGETDQEEKNMMGSCYEGALNSEVNGGEVTWEGAGTWSPQLTQGVCVDWRDDVAFVWFCDLSGSGSSWSLVNCESNSATSCP